MSTAAHRRMPPCYFHFLPPLTCQKKSACPMGSVRRWMRNLSVCKRKCCFVRPHSVMLCGRFYMPLLLVTVARGSKVPGAACSPFQSALTNHLLKWRTIMTTINLKRYYPYMTENVMLESMLRSEIKYYLS